MEGRYVVAQGNSFPLDNNKGAHLQNQVDTKTLREDDMKDTLREEESDDVTVDPPTLDQQSLDQDTKCSVDDSTNNRNLSRTVQKKRTKRLKCCGLCCFMTLFTVVALLAVTAACLSGYLMYTMYTENMILRQELHLRNQMPLSENDWSRVQEIIATEVNHRMNKSLRTLMALNYSIESLNDEVVSLATSLNTLENYTTIKITVLSSNIAELTSNLSVQFEDNTAAIETLTTEIQQNYSLLEQLVSENHETLTSNVETLSEDIQDVEDRAGNLESGQASLLSDLNLLRQQVVNYIRSSAGNELAGSVSLIATSCVFLTCGFI